MQDYSKYRIPTACGGSGCGSLKHNHKFGCGSPGCGSPPFRPTCK